MFSFRSIYMMMQTRSFESTFIFIIFSLSSNGIIGQQLDQSTLAQLRNSYNLKVACSRHIVNFSDIHVHSLSDPVYDKSRISLRGLMEKGRMINLSVTVTEIPSHGFKRDLVQKTGIFANNYNVHTKILPRMEELMMDYGDHSEPVFPDTLVSEEFSRLITLDPPNDRWKVWSNETHITLKAVELVLRSMAKWHALSAVLIENNQIPKSLFNESLQVRNKKHTFPYYAILLENFAELMRGRWDDDWKQLAEQMKNNAALIGQKILDIHYPRKNNNVEVLNIGDFYTKNLLFNYGITDVCYTDHPIAVKFIAFDMAHVNTPALDVNNFIYTSPTIVIKNRQYLIRNQYYPTLVEYLSKYGFKGNKPSLTETEAELRRTELFGVVESINFFATYVFKDDNPAIIDLIEESWKSNQVKVNMTGMLKDKFSTTMKVMMQRAKQENIFD